MNLGQHLALTRPWWMWRSKPMHTALRAVKLRHCFAAVNHALARNTAAGRFPATVKELAHERCLARHQRNVERVEEGTYALTDQHLLGLAVTLGIRVEDLLPPATAWLNGIVHELCSGLSEAPVKAFVSYRLQPMDTAKAPCREVDTGAVAQVFKSMSAQFADAKAVREAVLAVADSLGAVLQRMKEGQRP